jgi:hypothetical protein
VEQIESKGSQPQREIYRHAICFPDGGPPSRRAPRRRIPIIFFRASGRL